MQISTTPIRDLLIIEPRIFADDRGWFCESFNQQVFDSLLIEHEQQPLPWVQDNHSLSEKGVVRGLHYQLPPHAQGKLVRVVQGQAWDVAVDLRMDSPTFGQWFGVALSGSNHKQFWIPPGFAHGFIALEDNTQFLYKTTAYYNKSSERAILWNDEALNIDWPIDSGMRIRQTDKDNQAPTLSEAKSAGDVFGCVSVK
ncbi:dTDP-4-dehydrorhamnose 3,5-epimerase [Stenoxybacter acetivorans]|uniref:dTDP-4-dehydrorhamnose 3,5-epimerase n=1 Tax=Stenoxybacter acetivorans TaxID=422441 RepID=UPI00055E4E6C|nr:dTDP-4-dehydrorhamnose 3,5-epimerase [Stenoxybacter acetivorans]